MNEMNDRQQLRKLHELELSIAGEIRRICEKHGIRYFLTAGSTLGAVRHKGFIPWDDDMDIGMLREDYEEFLKVCEKELRGGVLPPNVGYRPGISVLLC